MKRRKLHCGLCGQLGHNRRSCWKLPSQYVTDPTVIYPQNPSSGINHDTGSSPSSVDSAYRAAVSGNLSVGNCETKPGGEENLTAEELYTWWMLTGPPRLTNEPETSESNLFVARAHRQKMFHQVQEKLANFLESLPPGETDMMPVREWEKFLGRFVYRVDFPWRGTSLQGDSPSFETLDARKFLARRWGTPQKVLYALAVTSSSPDILLFVACNPRAPASALKFLLEQHPRLAPQIASNPNTPVSLLAQLAKSRSVDIRERVVKNRSTPAEILAYVAVRTQNKKIRSALLVNPLTPREALNPHLYFR